MSIKTITKIGCFVIPLLFSAGCTNVSYGGADQAQIDEENGGFGNAEIIAHISSKEINESSGLAVSQCQKDVFWTHNDSGDGPFIYAFNSKGGPLGTFRVPNAENIDWEDIATIKTAAGECFLYIGEIGDNERKRDVHEIYRIAEPTVSAATELSSRKESVFTVEAEKLRFRYPDERHNSEALLVEPKTQNIFVVSKQFDGPAEVYLVTASFGQPEPQTAAKIAEISLPAVPNGLVTGGDISPDGQHVVLCDYYAGYEFVLPPNVSFNEIWKQKPAAFDLGPRDVGESVAFGNDPDAIYATTEHVNAPLIRVSRKRK